MGSKMSQTGFCISVGLAVVWLLLFGLWYARRIYLRPFRPGLTWLSVVLGCEATLLGMAILLWGTLHFLLGVSAGPAALVALGVPHAAFVLTGAPMILFQLHKDGRFVEQAFEMVGERDDGQETRRPPS
jgi:hypothetical protein